MSKTHLKSTVPADFYKGNFILVRLPQFAYSSYCAARDSWLEKQAAPKDELILDVGCNTGEAMAPWAKKNEIIGVDHSPRVMSEARENGLYPFIGDLNDLPFNDGFFDSVCAMGVIGFFAKPDDALEKITRVLKPGGTLYLSVATLGGLRLLTRATIKIFGIKNQMHYIPSVSALEKRLIKHNLIIEDITACPLLPFGALYSAPGAIARGMGAYTFIKARKSNNAN